MKAVIIEDEDIISKVLENKIKKVAPDIEVLTVLPSLKASRKWLAEHAEPDLMFMDIQLGDGVSFDIFNEFDLKCPVVFTTAYDEYAIRAFKVNGIDYLLKPVKEDELSAAIEKCRILKSKTDFRPTDMQALLHAIANPASVLLYKERFIVNICR
ncbi:MAG: response regulator [Chitinophagaceae bacterium]|nr:response regulator [Chitinophagaceae bacterium]